MVTVTAITCPVCGAPLTPGSSRCAYCGSLVTISLDHPLITPESVNQSLIAEHIKTHRTALRKDAFDQTAQYGLGVAYFNLGLLEESADTLTEAARLMPENPNIQFQLAVVQYDLGLQGKEGAEAKAIDRLKRTILLQPSHTDAHLLLADIQNQNEQWIPMLDNLEQAIPGAPDRVSAALRAFIADRSAQQLEASQQLGLSVQPAARKGHRTLWTTLIVSLFLCLLGSFVTEAQEDLGAVLILMAFGSLLVVPLVLRFRRGRLERRNNEPDADTQTVAPASVFDLLRQARQLSTMVVPNEKRSADAQTQNHFTNQAHGFRALEQDWEYAEITADKETMSGLAFSVEMTGPYGIRKAHRAGNFVRQNGVPPKSTSLNKERVNGLVSILVSEGWQPQGKGSQWYEYRFRRPIG